MSKSKKNKANEPTEKVYGDPEYPAGEDIYSKGKKEDNLDLDGDPDGRSGRGDDDSPAKDLDVPGSELDDPDEELGEEDEENNYYSLGGDDHDDLEDDKGD